MEWSRPPNPLWKMSKVSKNNFANGCESIKQNNLTLKMRKSLIMLEESSSPNTMKNAQDIRTDLIKYIYCLYYQNSCIVKVNQLLVLHKIKRSSELSSPKGCRQGTHRSKQESEHSMGALKKVFLRKLLVVYAYDNVLLL